MLNCCGDHFDFFSAGIVVILIDTAVNHADVIYLDEIDAHEAYSSNRES